MMVDYFALEPEVAGGLGENTVMDRTKHPPIIRSLHYEFAGWLGDELVESFPCYIVTESLAQTLSQAGLTGFELGEVEVSVSHEFQELYSQKQLPTFRWLKVNGSAGRDDFGIGAKNELVVSKDALGIIQQTRPRDLDVSPWRQ